MVNVLFLFYMVFLIIVLVQLTSIHLSSFLGEVPVFSVQYNSLANNNICTDPYSFLICLKKSSANQTLIPVILLKF